MALVIRSELAYPGQPVVNEEVYNQPFTIHGTIMLLLHRYVAVHRFRQRHLPVQIAAPDVAFPRLNMFSYWLHLFGAIIVLTGFLTPGGAADFGLVRLRAAL